MKRIKNKTIIYAVTILLGIMTLIGFGVNKVQAAELGDGSLSVEYSSIDDYYGKEAPTFEQSGYLFAGWYEDEACTVSYVKQEGETLEKYYAKFVPEQVLSVKAQHSNALHDKMLEDSSVGKIRFVTAVDSVNYQEVGLHVEGTIGSHQLDNNYVIKTVYSHLYVVDTENDKSNKTTASVEFGTESAVYFAPLTFKINYTQFDDDFTITPYWKTPDGVTVKGVTRTRNMIDNLEDGSCAQINNRGFYTSKYNFNVIIASANNLEGTSENPAVITLLKDVELGTAQVINGYTRITNKPGKKVTISMADTWSGNTAYYLHTNGNVLEIIGADATTKDNITFDGEESKYFFYNNSTLIVKNATLKNGDNSTTNATGAVTGSGGAINSLTDSIYQVTNCKFENNSSNNVGGAISANRNRSSSYILNSEFSGNTAKAGGAIYVFASSSTTVTSCTFQENESTSNGGAICSKGSLTVESCDFESNASNSWGGAIMLETINAGGSVTASEFYDNSAINGGAVGVSVATLDIISCEMGKENSPNAATNGGAIYVGNNGTARLTVDNQYAYNSLDYNTATLGGAICNDAGSVSVNGYTFTNNSATSDGGAIYSKSTLDVTKCDFQSNESDGDGGAIMLDTGSSDGTVETSQFYKNVAANGGALSIASGTWNIVGCGFGKEDSGNAATTHGGAIYVVGGTAILTADNSHSYKSFNYNEATNGGAVYVQSGSASVTGYAFTNNKATAGHGGAIFSRAGLVVSSGNFEGNSATSSTSGTGGAIYLLGAASNVGTVTGTTFYKNTAVYGGALGVNGATLNVTSCEMGKEASGNEATTNGGAVYVANSGSVNLAVNGQSEYKSLNYNEATNGGAIYVNAGTASVNGYTFTNNSASTSGGAIYSKAGLDITNCDFESNGSNASKTTVNGGAIMLDSASENGTVTASRFYKNSATNGGAISNANATLNIISCEMGKENSGNRATNGGAIYVGSGTVELNLDNQYDYKSLNYNSATNGGAICVLGGTVSVAQYDFKNNSATNGGAIQSRAGLTVTGGNYESNSATGTGGAIYQMNSGNGTVNGATFYRNSATNGGAIGCTSAILELTDCTFVKENDNDVVEGNNAKTNGAVAYVNGDASKNTVGIIRLLISDDETRSCAATSTDYDNLDANTRTIFAVKNTGTIELDSLYKDVNYVTTAGTITLVD